MKRKPKAKTRTKSSPPRNERRRSEAPDSGQTLDGWLTVTPRGFGFVETTDGGDDIFIAESRLAGAIHKDHVRVSHRKSPKGREGGVIKILERSVRKLTGRLRRSGKSIWLEPDDPRLQGPMLVCEPIPEHMREAVGSSESVVAEIVNYPRSSVETAEVRIERQLGMLGTAQVEVEKIKIRENIIEDFPRDVAQEGAHFPAEVTQEDIAGRVDFRDLDLVTIDPEDARDHDDAVWAEKHADGSFRIVIAIADVSHYVREGTRIDDEAQKRGCSVYLPDRAIPMLPEELSSNLASLVPNQDRLTMAADIHMGSRGEIQSVKFVEGVMRSKARLTYGSVARALELTHEPLVDPEAESRRGLLRILLEVSDHVRKERVARGALDFDLPEARVRLDPATGEPLEIFRSRQDSGIRRAYQMIEDLMLLCNEVVAQELSRQGIPTIYRIHGGPDETKLLRFAELAASFGFAVEPEAGADSKSFAAFLRRIEGTPHATTLGYLLLRSMQQATYDTANAGHFGLAAKTYLHFTSPIRRYPDLLVHRVLRKVLRKHVVKSEIEKDRKLLQDQAVRASRLERRAMLAEREVMDVYRTLLMRDRIGETFDAVISGVTGHGIYCTLSDPFVDVLCRVEDLGDEQFGLDELELRLIGQTSKLTYTLGAKIRLTLLDSSLERRTVYAKPEGTPERTTSPMIRSSHKPHRTKTMTRPKPKQETKGQRRNKKRH